MVSEFMVQAQERIVQLSLEDLPHGAGILIVSTPIFRRPFSILESDDAVKFALSESSAPDIPSSSLRR